MVFVDHTTAIELRCLKRGFRHCFVLLAREGRWLLADMLLHELVVESIDVPSDFDLGAFYRSQGHHVIEGERLGPPPRACLSLRPLTCVELVKRALGVRAFWVVTPHQLYRFLLKVEIPNIRTRGS
ncbi:MAG: hypothetical protein ACFB3T_10245 [Geminicoccaceae bacterium]